MRNTLITWPVLRSLGLYLGACWVAVEFADWIVARYSLPDRVVDLTLIGLLSFVPSVTIIAWVHGAPGRQRVRRVETIVVPVNLVLSAAVITALVLSRDAAPGDIAPMEVVTVTAPDGETMSRPVVAPELSRGITLFFFDNHTGERGYDWMQYGAVLALHADLVQHPFVKVWTPFARLEPYHMFRLRKAGYDDGLNVPVALKRSIAADGHMEFMASGRLEGGTDGADLDLVLTVYDTATTRVLREIRRSAAPDGEDLFAAVDEMTSELLETLSPPMTEEQIADLPVSSRLTDSMDAFEAHVNAVTATMIASDREAALAHWTRALEADSTFAVAQIAYGEALFQSGRLEDAVAATQAALRHEYKLVDAERFMARGMHYSFRGDPDNAIATYETWTELSPLDPEAFVSLGSANLYTRSNPDAALSAFERALDLDPREQWLLLKIASIHELKGNREAAVAYYTRYHDAHPDEVGPLISLGALHRREGDLTRARQFFERAAIVASGLVDPTLNLADVALREGRYEQALAHLEDAGAIAASPRQYAAVIRGRMAYHAQRGEENAYLALLPRYEELLRQFASPLNVLMGTWIESIDHYAMAGRVEEAVAILKEQEDNLRPPLNALVDIGYLIVSIEIGDREAADMHGRKVLALIDSLKLETMVPRRDYFMAQVEALQGDAQAALARTERSFRGFFESSDRVNDEGFGLKIALQLAKYREQVGQITQAREAIDYVLRRFPAHVEANLAMARLLQGRGEDEAAAGHLARVRTALAPADEGHPLRVATASLEATLGI